MDETQALLAEGVTAIQAGQRTKGRALLREVVRRRPGELTAWLWLADAVDEPEEKARCLERVLELAPGNPDAARELDKIRRAAALPAASDVYIVESLPIMPVTGEEATEPAEPERPDETDADLTLSRVGGKKKRRRKKRSLVAWALAGLLFLADGVLLLVVAEGQVRAGGPRLLVGLWNLATAVGYASTSAGLIARRGWGRRLGGRLAVPNVVLLVLQVAYCAWLGVPQEQLVSLCALNAANLATTVVLLPLRKK